MLYLLHDIAIILAFCVGYTLLIFGTAYASQIGLR